MYVVGSGQERRQTKQDLKSKKRWNMKRRHIQAYKLTRANTLPNLPPSLPSFHPFLTRIASSIAIP